MVAATLDNIMMVEGEMDEVQNLEMLEAIKVAHEAIKIQCQAQFELSEACGKLVKREYCHEVNDDELRKGRTRKMLRKGLCRSHIRHGQARTQRGIRKNRRGI